MMNDSSRRAALKISAIYLVVSALWITLSDYALYSFVDDPTILTVMQTFKGWFFITVTGLMLFTLINRDVMQLHRSEKSLRESEKGYKEIYDSITDAFFALDKDLRCIYWNNASAEFTGIQAGEAMGKTAVSLFPKIFDQEGEKAMVEVLASRQPQSFTRECRGNGSVLFFDISMYPFRSGISIFIKDITERRRTEKELKESLGKLRVILEGTVNVLASVTEKRDPYIAGHQQRVAKIAAAIAREMGLPGERVEGIRVAGILHDIGKISIPSEILNKPGPLSENEFRIVKIYPRISYEILKTIQFPWPVSVIALQHQEKMNGNGYPDGLANNEIILEARILAVADYIDAASSHRPYRPAMGLQKVMSDLGQFKGTLYDPGVVDAAMRLFDRNEMEFGEKEYTQV